MSAASEPNDERLCRLLLAIPELDRGGPDRVIFELARALDRRRFEVHLAVVAADGYYLDLLPSDVIVHVLGRRPGSLSDRYPGLQFAQLVRSARPDVVMTTLRMIQTAELASILGRDHALVARVAGHFSASRADINPTGKRVRSEIFHELMIRGLRHSDLVIAQSSSMAADLGTRGLDPDRVCTVPNPIDGTWVDSRIAEGPPASLAGSPRLLGVGRLEMQKGFDVLLRALPTIRAAYPTVHATVLGEGRQRAALERLALELGVSDSITLAGPVPNPFPYYAAADLLVAPSRWEGLSNTTLEALASGLPVVATDGPSSGQDLVTSDDLGRIVGPDDPEGFAAAVCDALGGRFDPVQIATSTRQRFATARIAEEYAAVLLSAAASRPTRGRSRASGGARARLTEAKSATRRALAVVGLAVSPGPRSPELSWKAPASRGKAGLLNWVAVDGALRGDARLRVLDVGARWGLEPGMDLLAEVADHRVVGVEPDPEAAALLRSSDQFDEVLEVALADFAGVRPLYLTRHVGCSSLRRPLTATTLGSLRCADWYDVVGEIDVDVTTLDAVAEGEKFDYVKLDAQGSDLEVLRGGESALSGVLGLFVEVQFEAIYEGQALFPELHAWATEHDLTLVSMSDGFQRKEGVLGEANCTYLPRPTTLRSRRDLVCCAIIAAALDEWGYLDLLVRNAGELLTPGDVTELRGVSCQRARGKRPIAPPRG